MGIRTLIRNLSSLTRGNLWSDGLAAAGSGVPSLALNVPGSERPVESVVMVYGCVMARREAIGGVPLRLSDDNDNLIENGPEASLMARPNSMETFDRFIRKLETYLALYDAAVIAKVGDGPIPDELIALHPACLTPDMGIHVDTGTAVATSWRYIDPQTGASKVFKPEQLVIRFGFNPHSPLSMLSPLAVLRKTIMGEIAAREQNLAMFLNDATPRSVLGTEQALSLEQSKEVLTKWNDANQGFANRHKTAFLTHGAKLQAVGLSPAEMEYLASLKFLRSDYFMVFRVTPAMVGDMTGETGLSQGSSTDSQKVNWWQDVGLAELDLIAGMLQECIGTGIMTGYRARRAMVRADRWTLQRALCRAARPRRSLNVWFDDNVIPALAAHRLAKLDQLVKICGLGWRPDDVSDFLDLGLPPHPDNAGRVAFSQSTIGADAAPKADVVAEPMVAPAKPVEPATGNMARFEAALSQVETLIRASSTAGRSGSTREQMDRFVRPLEKAQAKRLSRFFLEQRDRVLKRWSEASGQIKRDEADNVAGRLMPKDEMGSLVARIRPLMVDHMKAGAKFFAQETGMQNAFEIDADPAFTAALEKHVIRAAHMNETTTEDLRDILRQGFADGLATDEIGDKIAAYYNENCVGETARRPITAARTQTTSIVNEGRLLAARQVGGLKKAWLHGNPNEPREAHVAAQEQYMASPIDLDEKFMVNGFECDSPGDPDLPVEETANCTCTIFFVKPSEAANA